MQRRILDLVQIGDSLRPNPQHQNQRREADEGIEHIASELLHQHARHQRPDTGADAIGHQQHGRQRDTSLALNVVVGERDRQRIKRKLQQRCHETHGKQHFHWHVREDCQRQRSQHQ